MIVFFCHYSRSSDRGWWITLLKRISWWTTSSEFLLFLLIFNGRVAVHNLNPCRDGTWIHKLCSTFLPSFEKEVSVHLENKFKCDLQTGGHRHQVQKWYCRWSQCNQTPELTFKMGTAQLKWFFWKCETHKIQCNLPAWTVLISLGSSKQILTVLISCKLLLNVQLNLSSGNYQQIMIIVLLWRGITSSINLSFHTLTLLSRSKQLFRGFICTF